MTDITILCITKAERHAEQFANHYRKIANVIDAELIMVFDNPEIPHWSSVADGCYQVQSAGYIESVLDDAVQYCGGKYIFRIDDDEAFSARLISWLVSKRYRTHDHWAFPRANLWVDDEHYITNAPLWPDYQTRLSIAAKSGGRREIHSGSPYGTGEIASGCMITHYKYLMKSYDERKIIADCYESAKRGAGSGHYGIFSLPEDYIDNITVAKL